MNDGLGRFGSVAAFGGTSEIAQAILRALLAEGTRRIALAVRDPDAAGPLAEALGGGGAEVHLVRFDADAPETHVAVVEELAARLGDLDLAVVAFGVLGDQAAAERDPEAAAAVMRTNAVGGTSALAAIAARMRRQGHGTIVVLSSVAAERPRRANFAYGASKAAVDAYAQGLRDALAPEGIRVMVVRPGFVRTKMTAGREPAPLATDADTVARATLAGLRRGAHTVWVPAALRWVFVGMRHLPRGVWARMNG